MEILRTASPGSRFTGSYKKESKDVRFFSYRSTSCKEIVSSNKKEHIKWMIYGATVYVLFSLHLDSQKLLSSLLYLSCWVMWTNLKIACCFISGSFFISNIYCWQHHIIPWAGRESYWSIFTQLAKQSVSQSFKCWGSMTCVREYYNLHFAQK